MGPTWPWPWPSPGTRVQQALSSWMEGPITAASAMQVCLLGPGSCLRSAAVCPELVWCHWLLCIVAGDHSQPPSCKPTFPWPRARFNWRLSLVSLAKARSEGKPSRWEIQMTSAAFWASEAKVFIFLSKRNSLNPPWYATAPLASSPFSPILMCKLTCISTNV